MIFTGVMGMLKKIPTILLLLRGRSLAYIGAFTAVSLKVL
jgi:hypothetical protein